MRATFDRDEQLRPIYPKYESIKETSGSGPRILHRQRVTKFKFQDAKKIRANKLPKINVIKARLKFLLLLSASRHVV